MYDGNFLDPDEFGLKFEQTSEEGCMISGHDENLRYIDKELRRAQKQRRDKRDRCGFSFSFISCFTGK